MDKRVAQTKLDEPLSILHISGQEYHLVQEIGRGASSIAYEAETADGRRFIIKEFYPLDIAVRDENGAVIPCTGCETAFAEWKQRFEDAKSNHEAIGIQDPNFFLETANFSNSDDFVVMCARNGVTLDKWRHAQALSVVDPKGIRDHIETCIEYICYLAFKLDQIYHSNGYLHLDIKAENVFWFDNEKALLRLFDFDSLQKLDNLFANIQNKTASIYTTRSCYGPEVKHINQISVETPAELKAIDYYALGNLFYFMLYGCYANDIDGEKDEAVIAFLDHHFVLEQYINNLFDRFFTNFHRRICDYAELNLALEHIKVFFSREWSTFLKPFSESYLRTNFNPNMMPALFYAGEEYQGAGTKHKLYQLLKKIPGSFQVIGQGGSGKSTLLKHFAYLSMALFTVWKLTCHYVELRRLINDDSVLQLIDDIQESAKNTDTAVVWLLDALDEIDNKERARQLLENLNKLDTSRIRIIISSRSRIEMLAYPVVQIASLTDQQLKLSLDPETLKNLPFDFVENDFASTPLAVNLINGMSQCYNGTKFQHFKEYLIGEQQADGTIKISSPGELVWNYLHMVTLSAAMDSDLKINAGIELLHEVLTQSDEIKNEAGYLEHKKQLEKKGRYPGYKDIGTRELCSLVQFEKLGFYSVIDISCDGICGHKIEFIHKIFEDFFLALQKYLEYKRFFKHITSTADSAIDDLLKEEFPALWIGAPEDPYCMFGVGENPYHLGANCPFSLCKDIFNSSLDKQNILIAILNILRNHFNESPLDVEYLLEQDEGICYLSIVTELLHFLYTFESETIVFRNLDLSGLALGELSIYDNFHFIWSQRELLIDYEDNIPVYENPPRKNVLFENVVFDESLLWLKSYCWYQFKNCSFKNLNEYSFIHPSLNISDAYCAVGQDLYTINRTALMDCIETGDTKQKIVIYPETRQVDPEFAKHYTKRTRPIHVYDGNPYFGTDVSHNILYDSYSYIYLLNNVATNVSFGPGRIRTRYAALWYCDNLEIAKFFTNEDELLPLEDTSLDLSNSAPFSKCSNLKIIEIAGVPVVSAKTFENCTQIKGIHILNSQKVVRAENLFLVPTYLIDTADIDTIVALTKSYHSQGLVLPSPSSEQPPFRHPALFVSHDRVQKYLNCEFWREYFIYDEKRLPEIDTLPIDANDPNANEPFRLICKEDGFTDPYYPRHRP